MEKYKNKEWLFEEYVTKNRRAEDIGADFGVGQHTIWHWVRKFDFPKREQNHQLDSDMLYQNKDWLYKHFVEQGKTAKEISLDFGVCEATINKWVKKYDLRKKHYREKYVIENCAECGKGIEMLRRGRNARIKSGRKHFFCCDECYKVYMQKFTAELISKMGNKESSIEKKIRLELKKNGINFIHQYPIKYWCVDFYLPDYNLMIEVNGDYWHGNPKYFNELNYMQEKNVRRDKSKMAYLKKAKYNVLVLWETDINKRLDWCVNQIKEAIRTVG